MYFQPYLSAACFGLSVWSHLQTELFFYKDNMYNWQCYVDYEISYCII